MVEVVWRGLDYERGVLAAGPIGIMQAVVDDLVSYIHDHKQFGQAIGEFQLIQGRVTDMYTILQAGLRLHTTSTITRNSHSTAPQPSLTTLTPHYLNHHSQRDMTE